jgi:hypothetical protein
LCEDNRVTVVRVLGVLQLDEQIALVAVLAVRRGHGIVHNSAELEELFSSLGLLGHFRLKPPREGVQFVFLNFQLGFVRHKEFLYQKDIQQRVAFVVVPGSLIV